MYGIGDDVFEFGIKACSQPPEGLLANLAPKGSSSKALSIAKFGSEALLPFLQLSMDVDGEMDPAPEAPAILKRVTLTAG